MIVSETVGAREAFREAQRLSGLLEQSLETLRLSAVQVAEAERQYRLARARAWFETGGTAKQREDAVNAATAQERFARDVADAERMAALESVRSRRQQLSVLQSLMAADRAEADFSRTGPGYA